MPPYPKIEYHNLDGKHAYAMLKASQKLESGDYLCFMLEQHASRVGGPVGTAAVLMRDRLRSALTVEALRQGMPYGTYGLEDLPAFAKYTQREMLEHRRLWAKEIIDKIAGKNLQELENLQAFQ